MQYVLFDELLLRSRQIQLLHLVLKDVPRLLPVALVLLQLLVFRFDVSLGGFGTILHTLRDLSLVRSSGTCSRCVALSLGCSRRSGCLIGLSLTGCRLVGTLRSSSCCARRLAGSRTGVLCLLAFSRPLHCLCVWVRCYLLLLCSIGLCWLHSLLALPVYLLLLHLRSILLRCSN